jgi:transcription elongation factor Elf1
MVHYDPNVSRHAAQPPAPTCPKCGSHRTEVVDRTHDGRSVTVRCNACGARSAVLIDRRASDTDTVTDEIEAIRTVGRALAQLPDAASRVRVIRWASERFQIDLAVVAASAAGAATAPGAASAPPHDAVDPTLSMDGVDDFFTFESDNDDQPVGHADPITADTRPTMFDGPVMVTITAEPTTVRREPTPVNAQRLMLNGDPLFVDAELVDETPSVEETTQVAQPPRLESSLRTFVSDFQRLVLDLDTVFAAPAAGPR